MANEETDGTFAHLSFLLQQQIDAFVSLQDLVTAMYQTMEKQNPKFAETCKGILESRKRDTGKEQDQRKMWLGQARTTLEQLAKKK